MVSLRLMAAVILLLSCASAQAAEENSTPKKASCSGCLVNDRCLKVGIRLQGTYCWVDGELIPQKNDGESCENPFECRFNRCIDGVCRDKQPLKARSLYEEFQTWVFHIFRIVLVKRI
jgi:hypothetical protein